MPLPLRLPDPADETGATTIEYTLVLAFVASISIFATIGLIGVLLNRVAVLVVNIAMFLTGTPSP
jgi:Flp pilus assembly pilin Flp